MKNLFKLTALIVLTSFLLNSCKKEDDNTGNTVQTKTETESLEELFSKTKPTASSFTLDVSISNTLNGKEGVTLVIPANSIVDASGNPISGTVDAKLTEYRSIGAMASSGVTTISGNSILESAGMFNLEVSQNGNEVFLKSGSAMNVRIDQADFPQNDFMVFAGDENQDTLTRDEVNWVVADSVPLKPREDNTSVFFNFDYFQFGYCNIDRFFSDFIGNEISSFEIQTPLGMSGENTWALLMFEDYLSCAWTYWHNSDEVFKTHYTLGLGVKCKVLVVHVIDADNKEFEYALESVTLTNNTVVTPTNFTAVTESQISDIVENL